MRVALWITITLFSSLSFSMADDTVPAAAPPAAPPPAAPPPVAPAPETPAPETPAIAAPAPAEAAPAAAPPPIAAVSTAARRHEGKLYLRLHLGPAYTHMSAKVNSIGGSFNEATISGAGGAFGVAIGGSLTDNVVLFVEAFDDIAASPEISVGSQQASTSADTSAGLIGAGGGLAYFFPGQSNIVLSGTLAFAKLTAQVDDVKVGETDIGPALSVMLGKNWAVSPEWSLGLSGQVAFGTMKDKDDGPRFSTKCIALLFGASYR